jgi:hypothetical protein
METCIPVKDIDFLLRRNWFFTSDDLVDLLYLADESSWEWIVANRSRYAPNIQDVICNLACIGIPQSKMVWSEMTDEDYNAHASQIATDSEKKMQDRWVEFRDNNELCRPTMEIDSRIEIVYESLVQERKTLSKHKVIPQDIQTRILSLQNEFDTLSNRIRQEDKDWDYLTKTDFILNGPLYVLSKKDIS